MAKENRGSNKSSDSQKASAQRKDKQQQRDSSKFTNNSNPHLGASKGQSGQPPKR